MDGRVSGAKHHQRPLIGVTGPDHRLFLSWWFIRLSLALAGARMVRLTPSRPHDDAVLDGLIVSGGTDVDPLLYGKARKEKYRYLPARDAMETQWIRRAMEARMPLLGICRGVQLINVVRGGTLHLDIKLVCETARYPNSIWRKIFARKPVLIHEDSLLAKLFGVRETLVNSLHRQSLDVIGQGLTVTAWERNTIVQAVEGTDPQHFLLGVQWHPEFMISSAKQRRVFARFVREAAAFSGRHQMHSDRPAVTPVTMK